MLPFPAFYLALQRDGGGEQFVDIWRDTVTDAQWRELAVFVDGLRKAARKSDSA
jgi:hypothetical protein